MNDRVVDLKGRVHEPPPVTDFWFARIDSRLSGIEQLVKRLEWQVFVIVCACACVFVLELITVLKT